MDTSDGKPLPVSHTRRSRQKQLSKNPGVGRFREICLESSGYPEHKVVHVNHSTITDEEYLREFAQEDPVGYQQVSHNVHQYYSDRQYDMYRKLEDVRHRQAKQKQTAVNKLLKIDHSVVEAMFNQKGSTSQYKQDDVVNAAVHQHQKAKDRQWQGLNSLYKVERKMGEDASLYVNIASDSILPLTIDTDAYKVAVEYEGEQAGLKKGSGNKSTALQAMKEQGMFNYGKQRKRWDEPTGKQLQEEPPVVHIEKQEQLQKEWPAAMSLNHQVPASLYREVGMKEKGIDPSLTVTSTLEEKKNWMKQPLFKPKSLHQAYTEHYTTHAHKLKRDNKNQKKLVMDRYLLHGSRGESRSLVQETNENVNRQKIVNMPNMHMLPKLEDIKLAPLNYSSTNNSTQNTARLHPAASNSLHNHHNNSTMSSTLVRGHTSSTASLLDEPGLSPLLLTRRVSIISMAEASAPVVAPPKPVLQNQQFQYSTISSRAKMIEPIIRTRQETINLSKIPLSYLQKSILTSAGIDNKPRQDYRESIDFIDVVVELCNYICIWVNSMLTSSKADFKVRQAMMGVKPGYKTVPLPVDPTLHDKKYMKIVPPPFHVHTAQECHSLLLTLAQMAPSEVWVQSTLRQTTAKPVETKPEKMESKDKGIIVRRSVPPALLTALSLDILSNINVQALQAWFACATLSLDCTEIVKKLFSNMEHLVISALTRRKQIEQYQQITNCKYIHSEPANISHLYTPITGTMNAASPGSSEWETEAVNLLHEHSYQQFQLTSSLTTRIPWSVNSVNLDQAPFTTDQPYLLPYKNRFLNALRQDQVCVIDPYENISQEAQQLRRGNIHNVMQAMLIQVDPQLAKIRDYILNTQVGLGQYSEHVLITPHFQLHAIPNLQPQPDVYVPVDHEYKRGEQQPTNEKHFQKAIENSNVIREIKELDEKDRMENPSPTHTVVSDAHSKGMSRALSQASGRTSEVMSGRGSLLLPDVVAITSPLKQPSPELPYLPDSDFSLYPINMDNVRHQELEAGEWSHAATPRFATPLDRNHINNTVDNNGMDNNGVEYMPPFERYDSDLADISMTSVCTPTLLHRAMASRPVTPALSSASRMSSSIRQSVNKRSFQALPGIQGNLTPNQQFESKQVYMLNDIDVDEVLLPLSPSSRTLTAKSSRSSVSGGSVLLQSTVFDVSSGNTTWDVSLMAEYIEKHLGSMGNYDESISDEHSLIGGSILQKHPAAYRTHTSIMQQYSSHPGLSSFRSLDTSVGSVTAIAPIIEDPNEPNIGFVSTSPFTDTATTRTSFNVSQNNSLTNSMNNSFSGLQTTKTLTIQPPSPSHESSRSSEVNSPTISSPRASRIRRATQSIAIEEAKVKTRKLLEQTGHAIFTTDADFLNSSTVASLVEAGSPQYIIWILSHIVNAKKTVSMISELLELVRYTKEQRQIEEDNVYLFLQAASLLLPTNKNSYQVARQVIDHVGQDAMTTLKQAGNKMQRNLSGTIGELISMIDAEQLTLGQNSVYTKVHSVENRVGSMLRSDAIKQEAQSHTYEKKIEEMQNQESQAV